MLSGTTHPQKCIPYHFLNLWYIYDWLYFKELVKYLLASKGTNVAERIKVNYNDNLNFPHMIMWGKEKKQNKIGSPKGNLAKLSQTQILPYLLKIKKWGRHFLDNGLTLYENFYQLKKFFRSKQLPLTDFSSIIPSTEKI